MITTNFFGDIFNVYSRVKIRKDNQEFYKLNNIVYYLADNTKSIIRANDIWEIDIRSAFPTICKFLFSEEKDFLSELDKLKDQKLERNIFISTTLKGTEYLKQLNLISKMVISSVLMDADPDAEVLELKKDGISYIGNDVSGGRLFKKFTDMGFQIRRTKYKTYVRFQRTSHFLEENGGLIIKGVFKDRPKFLLNTAKNVLNHEEIDYDLLDKYYSKNYFSIIRRNILDELFTNYYLCEGNKYLNKDFRYSKVKLISNIDDLVPKNYLKLFIYPLLMEN